MADFGRLKNKVIAKVFAIFPSLGRKSAESVKQSISFTQTPWAPVKRPVSESRVALVTTAGVHLKSDTPFDMSDKTGDPTFRVVPSNSSADDITITHDYYDHTDADKDINIVFPIDRLREFSSEGMIGSIAKRYYGFMGHIEENHFDDFMNAEIPKVVRMIKEDGVDIVLLTPG